MGQFLSSIIYQALGGLVAGPALAWLTLKGRFGGRWADRLGFPLAGGGGPLWFHAASVGEAQSALTIMGALADNLKNVKFVLSVGTPAGLGRAQSLAPPRTQILAPPVDFWGAPSRALDRVGPRALIIVETELWPELIRQAQRRDIPVLVTAGRMSQKSHQRYQRAQALFRPLLASMPLVAVIGQADRARYLSLGARETQTEVVGNPKFDSLVLIARQSPRFSERSLGRKILIAGSTEENEESLIIDSWLLQAEKPHLILAPRHLGRLPGLLANLKERQLAYRLLSARPELDWPNEPDLIVVDCLGALGQLYAQADLAIIGGSLFRGQGHNPLEPAAYGRPVLYGPHMTSFATECRELESVGAARMVQPGDWPDALARWLALGEAYLQGQAGRELLVRRPLVGPALAELIVQALGLRPTEAVAA